MKHPEFYRSYRFVRALQSALICLLLVLGTGACSLVKPSSQSGTTANGVDSESLAMEALAKAHLLSLDGDLDGSMHALEEGIAAAPQSADLLLALAEVQLQRGDIESARKAVEAAISIEPQRASGYALLGDILLAQEDFKAAARALEKADFLQPADSQSKMRLAYALARAGEVDRALSILRNLVDADPDNLNALLILARFYRSGGSPEQSAETYRTLLTRAPDSALAVVELADVEMELQHPEQAVSVCRDYLSRYPDDTLVRRRLATIYLDQDRYAEALSQLQMVLAADPGDEDTQRRIGLIELQRQNWTAAVDTFTALLEKDPESGLYRYDLGVAREAAGDKQGALAVFAGISADSEFYPDAVMHRAYLLFTLDQATEAQALMAGEMEIVLSRPEAVGFLASLYQRSKNLDAAEKLLRKGEVLYPDNAELLLNLALLLDQRGEAEASERVARRVMELEPGNPDAPNLIAYSLAVRNVRLDEALELATRALSLEDAPHIRDTLGWVYYRLGRYADARRELEQAILALGDDPIVLEHFGDILLLQGEKKAAVDAYRRALNTGKTEDAKGLQRKIDQIKE